MSAALLLTTVAILEWQRQSDDSVTDRMESYHLTSANIAIFVRGEMHNVGDALVSHAQSQRLQDDLDYGNSPMSAFPKARASLYLAESEIAKLIDTQNFYRSDHFEEVTKRIEQQFSDLKVTIESDLFLRSEHEYAQRQLAALTLSLEQLNRLHMIAHAELVKSLPIQNRRHFMTLLAIITGMLAISFVATRRIMKSNEQATKALQESEERYISLSEASFEGLMVHDKGRVIDANTRIQEMFGYSLEELIKMSAFELIAPEDRELVQQNVAEGKEGPYEAVGLRKDSSTFPMELQARHLQYCGRRVRVVAAQDITERKRAEEALRFIGDRMDSSTGKEFFSSLVEHLATALNTRFAFVSEVVDSEAHKVRLLAYWMGSELGSNFEYDIRDSPCEHVVNKKLAFFPNGIQALFPDDIWLQDNEIQSYLAIPLFDSSGHPIGHFGVADIVPMEKSGLSELVLKAFAARASTEIVRNRAEQTLRQSEANLARAQEIAKIGNWHWDIAANKISWSDQYYQIVGLNKEEFAANYDASLRCIHPDDLEFFKKTTARVLREKTSWSIEYRIVRPDNDIRVIHERGEVSVDADGNAVSLFGTAQDITERKEVEENLRQSQFAVEHSSNPIYWVRKDGGIIYTNEAACRSLGYTQDELLTMSVYQIDPGFPKESWPAQWQDMKRNKRSTFETLHRHKDGCVFPVQITTSYLEYKSQEFIWAYVTDITERKRAEEALIAQAETERLLRRELDHRVRNNLASLISLIDMSSSGSDSTEVFAESIKGRVQTIARVHAALSHTKWHAIELRSLLNTLMDTSLEGHIKLDGPEVIIPPEQAQAIGLIIHEFATNSRKYGALCNPNGCVEVTWETRRHENGARQVHIRWLETGGPPIETEPKPGIGLDLIRGMVNFELRGDVDFRFPRHGADHTIAIPLTEGSAAHSEVMADAIRVDVLSFKKSAHPTPDR